MRTTIINTYGSFLRSGGAFKDAVVAALGRSKYLPDATVDALATVHAEHYGCEARQTKAGRWVFYAGDARDEAAAKAWGRWVGPFHRAAKAAQGGARTSRQVDHAARLYAAYEKLSAADRRRFKAML